jgi:DNA repair and recombination RAD54-like protein
MRRIHLILQPSSSLNLSLQAHRLKNADTATTQALASLATRRRVLLSGTPMQNDLEEFYAMVDFTNPGVLGTPSSFRRTYMHPILTGREPDADDKEKELADGRASELSALVNEFILRRTNALLSAHLPPKLVQIVFCKLTELQVWGLGLWV